MGAPRALSSPPPQPGQVGAPFLLITNTETDAENLEPSDERYNDRDSTTTPSSPRWLGTWPMDGLIGHHISIIQSEPNGLTAA